MSRWVFEPGNTIQFTFVSSVAPDSAPVLKVYFNDTVVVSITSAQSDSTHYYTLYTTSDTEGAYVGEWFAQKTFNSSARNFIDRFAFNISRTRAS